VDTINELGIQLILFIQNWGTWLEAPMRFFSYLGTEDFFLLVLPILYWSVDSTLGMQVGYMLLLNQGLNHLFKISLAGPRPYWVSNQVHAFASESSFGVPSGHAQSAMGVWGIMAAYVKKSWVWAIAITIIVLVGISRLYLAVHFPHDVVAGWLIGLLTLWLFAVGWTPVVAWLKTLIFRQQVTAAFLASMAMILLAFLLKLWRAAFVLEESWIANILLVDEELPDPLAMSGMVTLGGIFFGLSLGLAWMAQRGGFKASGPFTSRILCYLVGLVGVVIFWFGLGAVLPRGETVLPLVLRFLRYSLVGLWVTGAAPWLFHKLGLTRGFQPVPKPA
jgi:membrane-associated phospholipid phosphatase